MWDPAKNKNHEVLSEVQRWKDTVAAFKKRFSLQHLCHDAAHGPNVH